MTDRASVPLLVPLSSLRHWASLGHSLWCPWQRCWCDEPSLRRAQGREQQRLPELQTSNQAPCISCNRSSHIPTGVTQSSGRSSSPFVSVKEFFWELYWQYNLCSRLHLCCYQTHLNSAQQSFLLQHPLQDIFLSTLTTLKYSIFPFQKSFPYQSNLT